MDLTGGYDELGVFRYVFALLMAPLAFCMLGYVQIGFALLVAWVRPIMLKIVRFCTALGISVSHAFYVSVPHDLGYSVASSMAPIVYPASLWPVWLPIALALFFGDRVLAGARSKRN